MLSGKPHSFHSHWHLTEPLELVALIHVSLSSCHRWPPVITWRIPAPRAEASLSPDTTSKTTLTGGRRFDRILCNGCTWSPHHQLAVSSIQESRCESVTFYPSALNNEGKQICYPLNTFTFPLHNRLRRMLSRLNHTSLYFNIKGSKGRQRSANNGTNPLQRWSHRICKTVNKVPCVVILLANEITSHPSIHKTNGENWKIPFQNTPRRRSNRDEMTQD